MSQRLVVRYGNLFKADFNLYSMTTQLQNPSRLRQQQVNLIFSISVVVKDIATSVGVVKLHYGPVK